MSNKHRQLTLVIPETIQVRLEKDASSHAQLLQLPSDKIAIELHDPPDTRPKPHLRKIVRGTLVFFRDILPPLASALIAFFVFYYGKQYNDRQTAIQKEQTDTQQKQAGTAKSDLELKILSDFTSSLAQLTDKTADSYRIQTIAAIKFVQYGEKALPVIKLALGVEEDTVRKGATVVIVQLFQSGEIDRQKLLSELNGYFRSSNPYLRRGVLECFVKLEERLTNAEVVSVVNLLQNNLNAQSDYSRIEDQNVLSEAAVFLGGQGSVESEELLLKIAENRSCTKPRIQAIDSLPEIAEKLSPQQRHTILARLKGLLADAPGELKPRISLAIQQIQSMPPN